MPVFIFPLLLVLGLIGLGVLCVAARRAMARAEDPSIGRGSLLTALTGIPVAPRGKQRETPPDQE